jgi:pimeloyl-ACP methyl ester carboxylesterase
MQLAHGVSPEALSQAYEFFGEVQTGARALHGLDTGSFLTIGHSLGGAEAIYVAARIQAQTGQYVEAIGIDAPAFNPGDALSGPFLLYADSLFNMSTHGDAISSTTTFGGAPLGMIMPAEQIYLFTNPMSGYQYGPTGASIIEGVTYHHGRIGPNGYPQGPIEQMALGIGLILRGHSIATLIDTAQGDPLDPADDDTRTMSQVISDSRTTPRIDPGSMSLLDIFNAQGGIPPQLLALTRTMFLPYGTYDISNITFTENSDGSVRWPRLFGQFFRFDEWSLRRG